MPLRRRKAKAAYPQGAASNEGCAPGRQRHCRQRRRWADACHDNAAPGRGMSLPRTWKRVDMGPAAAPAAAPAAPAAPGPRKLLRYILVPTHCVHTREERAAGKSPSTHTRTHPSDRPSDIQASICVRGTRPALLPLLDVRVHTYPLTSQPPSDDVPSPPRTSAPVPNERPLAAPEDGDPASHSAKPRPPRLPLSGCLAGWFVCRHLGPYLHIFLCLRAPCMYEYIWRAPVGWAGGGELAGWREKEDASGPGNMPALPVKHPPKLVRDRSTSPIPKAVLFFVASKAIGFATRLPLCDSSHHEFVHTGSTAHSVHSTYSRHSIPPSIPSRPPHPVVFCSPPAKLPRQSIKHQVRYSSSLARKNRASRSHTPPHRGDLMNGGVAAPSHGERRSSVLSLLGSYQGRRLLETSADDIAARCAASALSGQSGH